MIFSFTQWLQLGVIILSFIPVIILFRYYRKTTIADYLLFCSVFVSIIISQLSDFLRVFFIDHKSIDQILVQINDSTQAFIYIFLFIHALRMKWEHVPKLIWYIGIIWFMIIQISIICYQSVMIDGAGLVIFTEMRPDRSINFMTYAFIHQNKIIMGHGFRFIFLVFRLCVLIVFLYVYLTISQSIEYKKIRQIQFYWVIASMLSIVNTVLKLGHSLHFITISSFKLGDIFNILTLISIAIVSIRYPEAVLVSKSQIIRGLALYDRIQQIKTEEDKEEFGIDQLVDYLQSIPQDLIDQIHDPDS